MENELKHLTDTVMQVLDRYEKLLDKEGITPAILEPHRHIIDSLLEKIKGISGKPTIQPTALRLGGEVPGPANLQNLGARPQIIHGAADDQPKEKYNLPDTETVPVIHVTDVRPKPNVEETTLDNIDDLSASLIENDSPVDPIVQTLTPAK